MFGLSQSGKQDKKDTPYFSKKKSNSIATSRRASTSTPGQRPNQSGDEDKRAPTKFSTRRASLPNILHRKESDARPAARQTPDSKKASGRRTRRSEGNGQPTHSNATRINADGSISNLPPPGKKLSFMTNDSAHSTTSDPSGPGKKKEFENDNRLKSVLRYIRILPPHEDETPAKKQIRIYTWLTLILDFIAAVVSITTYDEVTKCCEVPILSIAGNINWNKAIQVITYLYLVGIFAQVMPVVRGGMQWNLCNPLFGFMISFAVFFDDSRTEALCMWVLEACAVGLELLIYRLKVKQYNERDEQLAEVHRKLAPFMSEDKIRRLKENSGEDEELGRSKGSFNELRLLRERRLLRQKQSSDRVKLRYHLIGVVFNFGLMCLALLLIVFITRSGGLCIKDFETPNIFGKDQLGKCDACQGTMGVCEVCTEATSQCYYPYF
jgi:hypothetical protein